MVALTPKIKELIDLTDLFLLDIKHIDPEKCKDLVGFSNKKELEFARYLNNINKPVWIRQVLIPGYTDTTCDLLKLKNFISELNNVEKVEILPYHSMGKFKWEKLKIKYELEDVPEASSEDIKRAKEILKLN